MNVLVNGQLINYADQGKGRIIVLLHGWGANLATFEDITLHLSESFRVIRLDFPGFGGSPKPAGVWSVSDYAGLVADFLRKLNIDAVYAIAGHSFGGRVIIRGIASELLDAEKVILIDSAGVKPSKTMRMSFYKTIAKLGKAATTLPGFKSLRPMLRKKLYSAAGSTDYLNADEMQLIFLSAINEDLFPYIRSIKQPTLLIWGEDDQETPVSDAQKMLGQLPKGRLVVIPNAGHFVYVDDYDRVVKELDAFL